MFGAGFRQLYVKDNDVWQIKGLKRFDTLNTNYSAFYLTVLLKSFLLQEGSLGISGGHLSTLFCRAMVQYDLWSFTVMETI